MTPERWKKIRDEYERALELPENDRAAFVQDACRNDSAMREEILGMLASGVFDDGSLAGSPGAALRERFVDTDKESSRGMMIGPFKVLEELGEGGMGVVYLAEQTEPIHRRVAIKVIKPGMDTKQVVARFEAERQALSMMNHPNVARGLEVGTTDGGRPYFVMEHVPGEPITDYCDRHNLSTRERLDLFKQVCLGVQHAHQNGIIHRDIKPENVLVTVQDDTAVPKVIDFGVAKATHQRLTEKTLFTEQGQMIGTPAYMSPEQAEMTGLNVDTRTDIYSLGVLLYELLAGTLPFETKQLRAAAFVEVQRIIREVAPPKPSTRLSSLGDKSNVIARHRHTDPTSLTRQIRGDLDWITMKAMEKDRTRRYASASEFAADIARHLQHDVVLAGPPSVSYRMRKFCMKHKTGTALACALVVLVAGVPAGFVVHFRMDRLDAERDTARFLDRAAMSSRDEAANSEIAEKRLDDQLADIETRLHRYPDLEAAVRRGTAVAYSDWRSWSKASRQAELSLHMYENLTRQDPETLAVSLHLYARTLYWTGNYSAAITFYEDALMIREQTLGSHHSDTIMTRSHLAGTYQRAGHLIEAAARHREVLDARIRILGVSDDHTVWARNNLAACLNAQGRYTEAESLLLTALGTTASDSKTDEGKRASFLHNLAQSEMRMGKLASARINLEDAFEIKRDYYRSKNTDKTANTIAAIAELDLVEGKLVSAKRHIDNAIDIYVQSYSDAHSRTGEAFLIRGRIELASNKPSRALDTFIDARDILAETVGPNHFLTAEAECMRTIVLVDSGPDDNIESINKMPLDNLTRGRTPHQEAVLRIIEHAVGLCENRGRADLADQFRLRLATDDVE